MERRCSVCEKMFPSKEIKCIAHKNYCKDCYAKKRKNHRQKTKEMQPGYLENVARRKIRKPDPNINNILPRIKPAIQSIKPQEVRKKLKIRNLGLNLSFDEAKIIYNKHLAEEGSMQSAKEFVGNLRANLSSLKIKIKEDYKSGVITEEEAINKAKVEKAKFMEGLLNG